MVAVIGLHHIIGAVVPNIKYLLMVAVDINDLRKTALNLELYNFNCYLIGRMKERGRADAYQFF